MKLIIRLTLILVFVLTAAQVHADDFEDGVAAYERRLYKLRSEV